MKRSGLSKSKWKRLAEIVLILVVVSAGALLFRHKQLTEAELASQEERQRQAQQLVESTSEATAEIVKNAPALFVEGIRMATDPTLDLKYRKLEIFDRALEKTPESISLLNSRARLLWELELYEDGLADMNRIIELDPKDALNYYRRQSFHFKLKLYEDALADLDTYLESSSDRGPEVYNQRAYALAKLGRFEEALIDAEKSVSQNTTTYNLDTIGFVYVGLERYEEAVAAYDQALELDSSSTYALRGRAAAYRQMGNNKASQADLEAGRNLDPDFCLHWAKDVDPGEHASEEKYVLEAPVLGVE